MTPGYGGDMRLSIAALACLGVAVVGYVVRGDDYLQDYKNGGLHDWLTVSVIYAALLAFLVVCGLAVARRIRKT
jgi:hypothetical protein